MFASIDAVKNKRVYKFPQFDRSPDAAEIYLNDDWLARVRIRICSRTRSRSAARSPTATNVIYQKT